MHRYPRSAANDTATTLPIMCPINHRQGNPMTTQKYIVHQIENLGVKCKFNSMGAERDGWIMPDGTGVDYAGYGQLTFEPQTILTTDHAGLIYSRVAAAEVMFSETDYGYTYTDAEGWIEQQDVMVRRCYANIDQERVTLVFKVKFKPNSAAWITATIFNLTDALATDEGWKPSYSEWRHGGFYVNNVQDTNGGIGCVSNNYVDGQWRIVCDPRRDGLNEPGDITFDSREAAAKGQRDLVRKQAQELQAWMASNSAIEASSLGVAAIAAA